MIVIEGVNHIGVTVSNLEASVEFYKDLFDFDMLEKISNSGQAFMKMGESIICLYESEGYKCSEDSKNSLSLSVDEDDFEDALDEIEERKLEIVFGPENIRKGQTVIFLDPDKNRIELSYPQIG